MKPSEKCESLRKSERNKKIKRMYQIGCFTYEELGFKFNLSKQRIHQIVEGYYSARVKSIKIYKKNHSTCECCGSNKNLNAHHIDKNRRNNSSNNLCGLQKVPL